MDAKRLIKEIEQIYIPHIYCAYSNPSYINSIIKTKTHLTSKAEAYLI
jgi:hypothetical protein